MRAPKYSLSTQYVPKKWGVDPNRGPTASPQVPTGPLPHRHIGGTGATAEDSAAHPPTPRRAAKSVHRRASPMSGWASAGSA